MRIEFDIEEELKKLPAKPGVYLMHDKNDTIIYIGKAIKLCNRVRQYFQSSRKPSVKIEQMVSHISYFEYIVTDSEMEALVLECNLIKEHRPRYNTMLMDDKGYPYIKVTVGETFPRIMMARTMKKDKSRYFGPYTSAGAVKDTLELVRKVFALRSCNRILPRDEGKERPCLNYHIHQCAAPCQGYITEEEYRKRISQVIDFLNGSYSGIQTLLKQKMQKAAEEMEFEEAATYRDLLESVNRVAQKQKMTDASTLDDRDIIAYACEGTDAVVQVFFVREGKLIGRDHFYVTVAQGDTGKEILTSFVKQFYAGTPFIPKEVFLQDAVDEEDVISEWLSKRRGRPVKLIVPKKGQKERLVELASRNAALVLSQDKERIKREEQRTTGAVRQIEEWLGIAPLMRMEAYDISNTSGFESVGSMVVYENGKPKKNDYRKFRIRTVKGPNDYASMKEVLTRRFERGIKEEQEESSFTRLPDILMMDGGRGQVNIALEVLGELGLAIPVCGMVKDDRHRTRGLYYNNIEIPIDTHSEGFHLITRIQDEAHRFAIEYHKSLRSKKEVHSILDDIPGIGPKRRRSLMRTFGSAEAVRDASIEILAAAEGMNLAAAKAVHAFFHEEN